MVQVFEFEGGWDVPEERSNKDFKGFDDRDVLVMISLLTTSVAPLLMVTWKSVVRSMT